MRRALAFSALLAFSATATAQSLSGVSREGGYISFTGLDSLNCDLPNGPIYAQWNYDVGSPCDDLTPMPQAPSFAGDIAASPIDNTLWITDGQRVSLYESYGTPFSGWSMNQTGLDVGDLTGLGYDSQTDTVWATDGSDLIGFLPPFACGGQPIVTVGPTALPLPNGVIATDVEWDPFSGTLWVSDNQRGITEVNPDGSLGANGRLVVPPLVVGGAVCSLGDTFQGLAVDRTRGPGIVYITDGDVVVAFNALTGTVAPPTFFLPFSCNPQPLGQSLRGLAFNSSGVLYGGGSPGIFPSLGGSENAYTGNGNFHYTMAGGLQAGDIGLVLLSIDASCPPLDLGNDVIVEIDLINSFVFGAQTVGLIPVLEFPAPLPASIPVGKTIHAQGFQFDPGDFSTRSTAAFAVTTSLP